MTDTMDRSSRVEACRQLLEQAGFGGAELVASSADGSEFGDSALVFRVPPLLLRITSDRGESFLDVARDVEPACFYTFDDIEIAKGWRLIDEVLSKQSPEPLQVTLARLRERFDDLAESVSADRWTMTRAAIRRAGSDRAKRFEAILRMKT